MPSCATSYSLYFSVTTVLAFSFHLHQEEYPSTGEIFHNAPHHSSPYTLSHHRPRRIFSSKTIPHSRPHLEWNAARYA